MSKAIWQNFIGSTFGRLTVLSRDEEITKMRSRTYVRCRCSCGTEKSVKWQAIKDEDIVSCGCLVSEVLAERNTTHGGASRDKRSRDIEYSSWTGMMKRCHNENDKLYPYYGARGIKVTPEWCGEDGYERFLAAIGWSPGIGYSVDRIDNSRGYEPGNVRWATAKEQARNRRSTLYATLGTETLPVVVWCEKLGLAYKTVHYRLRRGWSAEKAFGIVIE